MTKAFADFDSAVLELLGPLALAGGKLSMYEVALMFWSAGTASEREACAKECDDMAAEFGRNARGGDNTGHSDFMQAGAEQCAEAIRARTGASHG